MKAYGIERKDIWALGWWSGSQSNTGNKTKSNLKKCSRRIYKKKARAKSKQNLIKEVDDAIDHIYCECDMCEPVSLFDNY